MPENQGRSRDKRFLDRVFTPEEQDLIRGTGQSADAVLWALWAGKEGAYKALNKQAPFISAVPRRYKVVFAEKNPTAFYCKAGPGEFPAVVETPVENVFLRIRFTPCYVHCLAMTAPVMQEKKVVFRVIKRYNSQDVPSDLHREARTLLSAMLNVSPALVEIHRTRTPMGYGPPHVVADGRLADVDISLSHDGIYGAVAVCH